MADGRAFMPFRGGAVCVSGEPLPTLAGGERTAALSSSPDYGGFQMPGLESMELNEDALAVRSASLPHTCPAPASPCARARAPFCQPAAPARALASRARRAAAGSESVAP